MRGKNSYFEILLSWAIVAGVLAAVGQINYWAAVVVVAELVVVALTIVHSVAPVWRWLQRRDAALMASPLPELDAVLHALLKQTA
jgi:hypothetical protein